MTQTPTDAGAADSGKPTIYEKCPELPGVLFCDSFEDPSFKRWAYTVTHNGTLTLTTDQAHTGATSLHAVTGPPASLTEARRATDVLDHQKSGHAWMRFYNWVPGTVVVTEHFAVAVMGEVEVPWHGYELRILPNGIDINSTPGVYPSAKTFPRDRWVCVELHVYIHPSAGFYEAYLDGDLVLTSTPPANTLPAMGLTVAEVGVKYAPQNQDSVEVYVDDVAVATTRIPCQ